MKLYEVANQEEESGNGEARMRFPLVAKFLASVPTSQALQQRTEWNVSTIFTAECFFSAEKDSKSSRN